jgi:hypothetical protein
MEENEKFNKEIENAVKTERILINLVRNREQMLDSSNG